MSLRYARTTLPVHPRTGLAALGLRASGAPIWPVAGGDGTTGAPAPAGQTPPGEGTPPAGDPPAGDPPAGGDGDPPAAGGDGDDPDGLGEKGKQAIERMKGERNAARKDLRGWSTLAKEYGAKSVDELRALLEDARNGKAKAPAGASPPAGDTPPNGDPTPAAPAAVDEDEIRRQAAAEAEAKANARIVRSEVRALATGRLSDPSDALRFLDLDSFEVAEDGAVDEEEITDAIGDLLTKKPYLAAAQRTKRFEGSGDGGAKPPKPAMSRSLGEAVSKALHQT